MIEAEAAAHLFFFGAADGRLPGGVIAAGSRKAGSDPVEDMTGWPAGQVGPPLIGRLGGLLILESSLLRLVHSWRGAKALTQLEQLFMDLPGVPH